MNFLQLCQMVRREARIPGSGPLTVVNQSGQLERVVQWTASAWRDIQLANDNWRWMRRQFQIITVADGITQNVWDYSNSAITDAGQPITRFKRWLVDDLFEPVIVWPGTPGPSAQSDVFWLDWDEYRRIHKYSVNTSGLPRFVSVDPQNKLWFGPNIADAIYTIVGRYQRSAQSLVADEDVPEMPADFHELIAYYALQKYGSSAVAAEVLSRAQLESARMMGALERDQLPKPRLGDPLL